MYNQQVDVKTFLVENGYQFKEVNRSRGVEYLFERCPYCETSGKGSSYQHFSFGMNGAFNCLKCGVRGNTYKFKRDFGLLPSIEKALPKKHYRPSEQKDLYESEKIPAFYDWYEKNRGISADTLKKYRVGLVEKSGIKHFVYHYYDEKGSLINRKYRSFDKSKMWTEKNAEPVYYGLQFIDFKNDYLNVVEGEDDAHSLVALGYENVVSLPFGAQSYSEAMDKVNQRFKTIFLFFDNDEAGQAGAHKFAEKAGLSKCFNVLLPFKDARECLLNDIKKPIIDDLIENADPFTDSAIVKAGQSWEDFKSYLTDEKRHGIALPVPEINNILGGVRMAELSVLTGQSGKGKSTFAFNFAAWCVHAGLPSMILSFELPLNQVKEKLIAIYSNEILHRYDKTSNKFVMTKDIEWIHKHIVSLNDKNLYFLNKNVTENGGFYSLKRLEDVIRSAVKFYDIQVFVIDHLHYFLRLSGERNAVYVIDEAMRTLRLLTEELGIHILLVVHPSKTPDDREGKSSKLGLNSGKGAASIVQEANNYWVIERADDELEPYVAQLSILKNRLFGKTGRVTLSVSKNMNTFYTDNKLPLTGGSAVSESDDFYGSSNTQNDDMPF